MGSFGSRKRIIRLGAVLWLGTSLTGCASMPFGNVFGGSPLAPKPTEVELAASVQQPATWDGFAPNEFPDTDWVASFDDSVLNALITEGLQNNRDIKSAYANLRAAEARLGISKAGKKPSVDGQLQVSRNQRGNDIFASSNNINLSTNISWEWDLWGRIRDQIASSQLDIEASRADAAATNLSIAGQVSQGWFDLIEANLLVGVSNNEVETRERSLRLTQRRFEGGVTPAEDVRLARSTLANAKATLSQREQSMASIGRGVEILLSRYPANELAAAEDLPELPALTGAANPQFVLTKRPDLLAAEARLYAQGLDVDEARRALRPNLTFSANPGVLGTSLANTFDPAAFAATIAANLVRPIYRGGALKADVAQQNALLEQQIQDYADLALNAFLEVENALDAERRLAVQEAEFFDAFTQALKAEQRLELRYSEGLATILQLLDAQSRRLTSEGQYIAARKDRLANRVRLHMALGGGQIGDVNAIFRQAAISPQGTKLLDGLNR